MLALDPDSRITLRLGDAVFEFKYMTGREFIKFVERFDALDEAGGSGEAITTMFNLVESCMTKCVVPGSEATSPWDILTIAECRQLLEGIIQANSLTGTTELDPSKEDDSKN